MNRSLYDALQSEVARGEREAIAKAATDLSRRYRTGRPGSDGRFAKTNSDIQAYAAFRMPATYAALCAALGEVKARLSPLSPRTLLDVGSGPGTAMWAATAVWPEIEQCTLIEREPEMIVLGKRLATHSELDAVRRATWIRQDLTATPDLPGADLVVASYVLGEMGEEQSDSLAFRLWRVTERALVLVEPGTPGGFERIRRIRERLLATGARVVAPCPHDGNCPISDGDWCHFGARVQRSRLHRQLKEGELAYEDEKYSYVAFSKAPIGAIPGRVIRRPEVRKGHVRLHLCTESGIQQTIISRKERERFRFARKAHWGSAMIAGHEDEPEVRYDPGPPGDR